MALHPTTVVSIATYNQNFLPKYTTGKIIAVVKDCGSVYERFLYLQFQLMCATALT